MKNKKNRQEMSEEVKKKKCTRSRIKIRLFSESLYSVNLIKSDCWSFNFDVTIVSFWSIRFDSKGNDARTETCFICSKLNNITKFSFFSNKVIRSKDRNLNLLILESLLDYKWRIPCTRMRKKNQSVRSRTNSGSCVFGHWFNYNIVNRYIREFLENWVSLYDVGCDENSVCWNNREDSKTS